MSNHALLVLQEGVGVESRRWPLDRAMTVLGRGDDCDVVLSDREVSRQHAQILRQENQYVLVDLGSKNGTLLNGARLDRAARLGDGDEILIPPRFRFLFVDADATVPARLAVRGVSIDAPTRSARVVGQLLDPPLAPNQYALLQLLLGAPGRVFSRDEIAAHCYPEAAGGVSDLAIDGVVRRLRARLAQLDATHDYIVAVRGHGFRLVQPPP